VILGVDVRDGAIAVVRVTEDGQVIARSTQAGATGAAAVDAIREIDGDIPKRIGAAVRDPGNAAITDIVAAAAGAAKVIAAPKVVTKGAAVALAEQWLGAAQGARHVVGLTATDCVDAGIVVDGHIFEGAHGLAGAAGWLALNPVERDDYRRLGCLEAEIGGSGIVRRLVWRIKAGDHSRVLEMAGGQLADITVPHIFDAARQGDGVAIAVVRDTARYIGMAIGNLVAIVDPEVVVLGGLIAEAADLLLEPSRAEAGRRVSAQVFETLRIVPGMLGDEAAAIGAARAALLDRR
jgi:predicted NBD/HSP70 family sugar kinase